MRAGAGLRIASVAWLLAAAAVAVQARQRQPVFRAASDLVEIDAVVTDRHGAVVRGLTRNDFVVTEDGVPQPLVQFSFVDIPAPEPDSRAAAASTARADVATNAVPRDGRLYVIVLDAFHVDPTRSTVVRKLARQFVEQYLGPDDLAAVVQFGPASFNQPFTSDKTRLVASIDRFVGRKPVSATLDLLHDAMLRPQEAGQPEDAESGVRANDARIMLESIKQLCERLGSTQGHRRSIVVFGEGIDFDTSDLIGEDQRPGAGGQGLKYQPSKHAGTVLAAEEDLFVAARRANVALYTVDPRGNTIGDEDMMQAPSAPGTGLMREAQRGQGTLRTFASETGGLSVVGTNDIATGFSRIVQANSSYYVLGYGPPTPKDGAYHRIGVTVKGRDVEVTARKGYFAAMEGAPSGAGLPADAGASIAKPPGGNTPSPRLRDLLASQLPIAGLGLRVTGGPLRAQGDKDLVALVVELDTHALPFTETGGQLANDIEIGFVAVDAGGKTAAASRTVGNLRVPASARGAAQNGLRYVVEFPVAPGAYQVRVAADESAGGTGGSAILDVTAPSFAKSPLSVGAVFIAATESSPVMPTTGAFPVLQGLLPAPPTAVREFASTSPIVAVANICVSEGGTAYPVSITTTVRGADGREVFRSALTRSSADMSPAHHGYDAVSHIALTGLAPGQYVLMIDAKAASGAAAAQSVAFAIR